MSTPSRPEPAQVVERWQRPVFNLAYRMLGNRTDAEDATQDVFERVFRNYDRYNPERPLAPWVFRITRNVVLNHIRSRRSQNVTWEEKVSHPDDSAGDAATAISDALEHLDVDQRLLVSLHFFGGLTKKEIASVLSVPRTTVQSRMSVALGRLRECLAHTQWAVAPGALESAIRGMRPAPVPTSLASRLQDLARDATGASVTTVLTTAAGGLVLSKCSTILLLLGALMIGLGGYTLGRTHEDKPCEPKEHAKASHETAKRLSTAGSSPATGAHPSLEPHHSNSAHDQHSTSAGLSVTSKRETITEASPAASSSSPGGSGIPWDRMGTLLAEVIRMDSHVAGPNAGPLTTAEQKLRQEFAISWFSGLAAVRLTVPDPFFDESILTAHVKSCFADSLALDKTQVASLNKVVRSALERERADLEGATLIERFAARLRIRQAVYEHLDGVVQEDHKAEWTVLKRMGFPSPSPSLGGDLYLRLSVGVDDKHAAERIAEFWKKAYAVTPPQMSEVRFSAGELVRLGSDAMQRLPEPQRAMRFAELQSEAEAAFRPVLTAKQREAAANQALHVIGFVEGAKTEESEDI